MRKYAKQTSPDNAKTIRRTVATVIMLFATYSIALSDPIRMIDVCLNGSNLVSVRCVSFSRYSLDKIIDAIAQVESGGQNIMGDQGKAAGIWQLHKCAIDHINQKYKTTYKWPSDCLNQNVAKEIVIKYLTLISSNKKMTLEELIRRYNGGYKYCQSNSSKIFWLKVKKQLDN